MSFICHVQIDIVAVMFLLLFFVDDDVIVVVVFVSLFSFLFMFLMSKSRFGQYRNINYVVFALFT